MTSLFKNAVNFHNRTVLFMTGLVTITGYNRSLNGHCLYPQTHNRGNVSDLLHYITNEFQLKEFVIHCSPFKGFRTGEAISARMDT